MDAHFLLVLITQFRWFHVVFGHFLHGWNFVFRSKNFMSVSNIENYEEKTKFVEYYVESIIKQFVIKHLFLFSSSYYSNFRVKYIVTWIKKIVSVSNICNTNTLSKNIHVKIQICEIGIYIYILFLIQLEQWKWKFQFLTSWSRIYDLTMAYPSNY